MDKKTITVYELRGIGDDVNFTVSETDEMCDAIKKHLAENVLDHGTIIEIVTKKIYEEDFKRLA